MQQISGDFPQLINPLLGGLNPLPGPMVLLQTERAGVPALNTSGWTPGQTYTIPVNPIQNASWKIYGWAISWIGFQYNASWFNNNAINRAWVRQLPNLWGGVLLDQEADNPNQFPSDGAKFPRDLTTIAKLHDGQADPTFPLAPMTGSLFVPSRRSTVFMLPTPVVTQTRQIAMTLVMDSFLTFNVAVGVSEARWTLLYDLASKGAP